MHDDLTVNNRENTVEYRRLGQGESGDEDRRDHDADVHPTEAVGRPLPVGAFKRPGRC